MTGADATPRRTAVLLLGFQKDLFEPRGMLARSGADVSRLDAIRRPARAVLAAARDVGLPVLHAPETAPHGGVTESAAWRLQRARNGWPSPFGLDGGWGAEPIAGFEPIAGELVVPRHRCGALFDTRMPVLLRSAGARELIIMGAEVHRSVIATTIQGASMDFEITVPLQAIAATDAIQGMAAVQMLESWARLVDVDELAAELRTPAASAVEA